MQFLKVSCNQCGQYKDCPQRTRMFVNYCGSDRKRVKSSIRNAELECRARRGYLFKKPIIIDALSLSIIKNVPASVS